MSVSCVFPIELTQVCDESEGCVTREKNAKGASRARKVLNFRGPLLAR